MDAIDKAIAERKGGEGVLYWRGQENQVLHGRVGNQLVSPEARQIRDAYKQTVNAAFSALLQGYDERRAWQDHKLFILGVGSLVDCLVDKLRQSPLDEERTLEMVDLDVPRDIRLPDGSDVHAGMFPHVVVAYGLSGYSSELPDVEMPSQTPPMGNVNPASRRYQMIKMDALRY